MRNSAERNNYIYQRGLLALPSDIDRAMREASGDRTVTDTDSRAYFLLLMCQRGDDRGTGNFIMGIIGSSFYDSINKVLTGFLLILPVLLMCNCKIDDLPISPAISDILILALSWIVGLVLWGIQLWISIRREDKPKEKYVNQINKSYEAVINKHNLSVLPNQPRLTLPDYYRIYYQVQKNNLLGSVPILEAFSAFFLNLIWISIIWIVILSCLWLWPIPWQLGMYFKLTQTSAIWSIDFLFSMEVREILIHCLSYKMVMTILIVVVMLCWLY